MKPYMAYEHANTAPCFCCRFCGKPRASERHRRWHARAEARQFRGRWDRFLLWMKQVRS